MTQIRAARWKSALELEISTVELDGPSAGEVQVSIQSAGICGSDLHAFRNATGLWEAGGLVPGHEIAGVVSAIGAGVSHVREGDVVGIEPLLRSVVCGTCRYCLSGEYQVCTANGLPGGGIYGEKVDGGMREMGTFPGPAVFLVPSGVDAELAALAEPLACSVHGYEKIGLRANQTVLIVGAGTIGLTALLAAKAAGSHAIITARHPHQQDAARRMGADEVIGDDEAGRARLDELAAQEAIDVAVETVGGRADTLIQAQHAVRRMGTVIVIGIFTDRLATIDALDMALREVQMVGAIIYGAPTGKAEYAMALDMLADNVDTARTLITHRFPLTEANEAFAIALDKSSNSIKVHINPNTQS
jgi:(R,R)-butanediol dehydrogenase/meso-butanediol dehydrogenase/diacetyl reductase/L-iditol 2-dehydrogenase